MKKCVPLFILMLLAALFNSCSKHPAPGWLTSPSAVVDPVVGIGPVHAGVTMTQVVTELGKPDEAFDVSCDYTNLGFTVYLSDGKLVHGIGVRNPFAGHTKEGIGIGSSRADVIKAYGEPTAVKLPMPEMESLIYKPLGMTFQIKGGMVDLIIVNFKTAK